MNLGELVQQNGPVVGLVVAISLFFYKQYRDLITEMNQRADKRDEQMQAVIREKDNQIIELSNKVYNAFVESGKTTERNSQIIKLNSEARKKESSILEGQTIILQGLISKFDNFELNTRGKKK